MAEKLALDGGERIVPEDMVRSWPPHDERDRKAIMDVFDSDIFHGNAAPHAVEMQEKWADYCGCKYALVTNSGTSALHMAVAAAGVLPGDEVITSAFSFWASAAAILHHCAIPTFVDLDPVYYTIDPKRIEAAITPRTKAIMPVHIHGMPAELGPILEIAEKHNLKVVHDACQAHGATWNGKRLGGIVDTTGFSTNRSKNLSSGEGGIFTTNDDDAYEHARRMREFGEVVPPSGQQREYNAFGLGWNYRPHEFVNAFMVSQFERLPQNNAKRQELARFLTAELAEIPGVEGPAEPPWGEPVYFTYVVEFRPDQVGLDCTAGEMKAACVKALQAEGIGMGQWQSRPIPGQDVLVQKQGFGRGVPWVLNPDVEYEYRGEDYPLTMEFIAAHSYLRGVYPPNDMPLMERYVTGFRKVMDNISRVMELAQA
ncbi:MAG: DegT/DnrJ/EryC1/StrS family aminotransferase [candidate division WS1 bacterium]|jgi:dTDP-4-amino-4,6-dideoxygalactose transaminase|nr:DegT/DnrJ/EryC1/StrS family aminotransferase [candidate division WS1 bacterium]